MLLIFFNLIFWLSGAAILAVGIWILVDKDINDYLDVIKDATDEDTLRNAAYILLGFVAFVFLVGFCGCCGAIRRSKCLLGFYILFLIIVCGGELAAGITVAIYRGEAEDKLDTGLQKSIKEKYGESLGAAWDLVQKELKCCGGVNSSDYDGSVWQQAQAAANKTVKIPPSCCILKDDGQPVDLAACQTGTEASAAYINQGCKSALVDWIDDHSIIFIGVGCGIAGLEILGLICAICFCRHMDEDKYSSQ